MKMTKFLQREAFHRIFLASLLFTVACITASDVNLALMKPAIMYSTSISAKTNLEAGNAVDGNLDGNWSHGSCSQTHPNSKNTGQWWMVDLLMTHLIISVHILYRQDKLTKNFGNFVIETFRSNPTVFPNNEPILCLLYEKDRFPGNLTLYCTQPVQGRFLRIRKLLPSPYSTLTLCEVMVYGSLQKDDETTVRKAFLKMESHTHLQAAYVASYANKTLLHCAGICVREKRCQGVNHNHLTSTCVLVFDTWDTDPSTTVEHWALYRIQY